MRKAQRLFQLLTLLRSRRGVLTAQHLAEQLEVSERTIYRDMEALIQSGMPIDGAAGVGYRLRPGFNVPPLMFDEEELEALLLGVRMVQGWSDDLLGRAADRALHKIRAALPDALLRRHGVHPEWLLVPDIRRQAVTRFGGEIREALRARKKLDIGYRREDGAPSQRRIRPLGLAYWGYAWTLIAWCELRGDYRMFRLDRITELKEAGETFATGPDCSLRHYLSLVSADC